MSGMKPSSRRVTLACAILFALLMAAWVPLWLLARQSPLVNGGEVLGAIPFAVVGLVIARRQPSNPIGWLLFGIGGCLLLSVDSGFYAVISYRLGHHPPLAPAALFLYELWGPGLLLFALVILLFPDGTLPSRSARVILWAFAGGLALFTGALVAAVVQAVAGHHVGLDVYDGLAAIDSPTGWFASTQAAFAVVGAPFVVWCVARQVLGWRRASGDRRQQLKWLASGVTVAVLCLILGLLVPGDAPAAERTLANVISVGRRFNRTRYDAERTVAAFAARLKDAVNLDSVCDDLTVVVQQALEPAHLSMWLSQRPDWETTQDRARG